MKRTHSVRRIPQPLLCTLMLLIGLAPSFAARSAPEVIGNLAEAQGRVELNGAAAQAGAELRLGMRVVTGPGSQAVLKFIDGQIVALKSESVFWIKNYRQAPKPAENRSTAELLKGGMRFISGAIARESPEAVRIDTPVATIGIRGTEFSAALGSLCLLVHRGTVLVTAAGKTVAANPGEMVFVRDTNSRPRLVPAPEAGYQCDAPQRDSAAPEDVRTIVCTCSSLLATIPDAILASDAGTRAAAAAAAASAVIVDKIRRDDPKASP